MALVVEISWCPERQDGELSPVWGWGRLQEPPVLLTSLFPKETSGSGRKDSHHSIPLPGVALSKVLPSSEPSAAPP